jgi:hypothetical protein
VRRIGHDAFEPFHSCSYDKMASISVRSCCRKSSEMPLAFPNLLPSRIHTHTHTYTVCSFLSRKGIVGRMTEFLINRAFPPASCLGAMRCIHFRAVILHAGLQYDPQRSAYV